MARGKEQLWFVNAKNTTKTMRDCLTHMDPGNDDYFPFRGAHRLEGLMGV